MKYISQNELPPPANERQCAAIAAIDEQHRIAVCEAQATAAKVSHTPHPAPAPAATPDNAGHTPEGESMKARIRVPKGGLRFNERKVVELVGKAARDALLRVGADVREKTRNAMSNRNIPATTKQWRVGERDGRPLVALVRQVAKPSKVTSWKTPAAPGGRLREAVKYYFDTRTKSVVIGPERMDRVKQLHEFGGSVPTYFVATGGGPKRSRKFKNPVFGVLTNRSSGSDSIYLGQRKVKRRPYMSVGLKKSLPKIPQQFRNRLHAGGAGK